MHVQDGLLTLELGSDHSDSDETGRSMSVGQGNADMSGRGSSRRGDAKSFGER